MSNIAEKDFLSMVKEAMYVTYLEKHSGEVLDKTEEAIRKARELAVKGSAAGAGAAGGLLLGRAVANKINPAAHPVIDKALLYGSPLAISALAHIGKKALEEEINEDSLDLATHGMLGGTAGMGLGGGLGHLIAKKPSLGALIGGGTGAAATLAASYLLNKKREK